MQSLRIRTGEVRKLCIAVGVSIFRCARPRCANGARLPLAVVRTLRSGHSVARGKHCVFNNRLLVRMLPIRAAEVVEHETKHSQSGSTGSFHDGLCPCPEPFVPESGLPIRRPMCLPTERNVQRHRQWPGRLRWKLPSHPPRPAGTVGPGESGTGTKTGGNQLASGQTVTGARKL